MIRSCKDTIIASLYYCFGFQRFNSNEFETTEMLVMTMAVAGEILTTDLDPHQRINTRK